ncbi:MAG TPA: DUF4157 domain-containing protein [Solirubrobacteraceae bacterium]|nr:DUF4157 domain-containing protein [Solirubrobacteraceae bacterium]
MAPPRRARARDDFAAPAARPRPSPSRPAVTPPNGAFARVVEAGGGVLPGGSVHPSVERAIAAEAPRGRPLAADVAAWAGAGLGDELGDVRVHTGATADALARAVSARAFTVRRDVFFARGEYRPDTASGRRLLGHELTHAVQQRGAPAGGPLKVTERGDPSEREADRVSREIGG